MKQLPSFDSDVPVTIIERQIYLIRGQKVMLDSDLAELYGVRTKALNQAVRRNKSRFPSDFMFQLNVRESSNLRSQSVTSSLEDNYGGRRYLPLAFTEQGVAMLSTVLKSERAIKVNIAIMRVFVRLRAFLASHKDLAEKIELLETKYDQHESHLKVIFEVIRQLARPIDEEDVSKPALGFESPTT